MKIIFLGKPGSGKGTQAKKLSAILQIPHISTGDIIRKNIANQTTFGIKASEFISQGHLVPDDLILQIVAERLKENDCENGYIFDGFPRTIIQAKKLNEIDKIDLIINIQIEDAEIEKRLTLRRVCNKCGEIYNLNTNKFESCPKCNVKLSIRADDNVEVIRARIKEHNSLSEPLINYYKDNVVNIDGSQSQEKVAEDIQKLVSDWEAKN